MWFWKNNGPRPPLAPDEVLALLFFTFDVYFVTWLVRGSLTGMYDIYLILHGMRF